MSKFSPEDRAAILEAARDALESAAASLAEPRPQIAEPPVEDRLAKWRRQVREQEERFAAERAQPQPLTDYEAAQFQRDTLSSMLAEQKEFLLAILAHSLAGMRDEILEHVETKLDLRAAADAARDEKFREELRQVRADQTTKGGGEVIDAWPRKTA